MWERQWTVCKEPGFLHTIVITAATASKQRAQIAARRLSLGHVIRLHHRRVTLRHMHCTHAVVHADSATTTNTHSTTVPAPTLSQPSLPTPSRHRGSLRFSSSTIPSLLTSSYPSVLRVAVCRLSRVVLIAQHVPHSAIPAVSSDIGHGQFSQSRSRPTPRLAAVWRWPTLLIPPLSSSSLAA